MNIPRKRSSKLSFRRDSRSSKKFRRPQARLGLESLEARQLLAADCFTPIDDAFLANQSGEEQVLDVLSNDFAGPDYAGAGLITAVGNGSEGGRLSLAEDGLSIAYTPPANFAGTETFSYVVDGEFTGTVSIEIAPAVIDDEFEINPVQQEYTLNVLENDPFWESYTGDGIITMISQSIQDANVEIASDGRSLLYTPTDRTSGRDVITYLVDGKYAAQVEINLTQPLEHDDFNVLKQPGDVVVTVLNNDPFWQGYSGEKRITHILDAMEGTEVRISDDGSFVYVTLTEDSPDRQWFRYVVDGKYEAWASVTSHEIVSDDHVSVDMNSSNFGIDSLTNDGVHLRGSDLSYTPGSITRVDSVSANGGSVRISTNADFLYYTAPEDFLGEDTFTYTVDGEYTATVTVDVGEPVRPDHLSVYRNTADNRMRVLENDFQGNGYQGPRRVTEVSETTNGGSVELREDGSVYYSPPTEETIYSDSFTYTVDGRFEETVTVSVRRQVADDDFAFREGQNGQLLSVMRNDGAMTDTYLGDGTITSFTQPDGGGTVELAPNGQSLIYSGFHGESFTYTVDNEFTATVRIHYPEWMVADRFAVDQNSSGGINVRANDREETYFNGTKIPYTGAGTVTAVSGTEAGGTVTFDSSGEIFYTAPEDFHGQDTFTYTVDGTQIGEVTVDVIRRVRDDQFRIERGSSNNQLPVMLNDLLGGNYDGPGVITELRTGNIEAQVEIGDGGKSIVYTPNAEFRGEHSLTYVVDDQFLATVEVSVSNDRADQIGKFETLEEFREFVINQSLEAYYPDDSEIFARDLTLTASSTHFSDTNVQVEGVDEADLVENDGEFLYSVLDGQLSITRAFPADQLELLSQTPFTGNAIGAYLNGDRLTVVSRSHTFLTNIAGSTVQFDGDSRFFFPTKTEVTVFDISDRSNPQVVQSTTIDGSYVESRRIDNEVFVVTSAGSLTIRPLFNCDNGCEVESREDFVNRVEAEFESLLGDLLPDYVSRGPDGEIARQGLLIAPEDIYRPLDADAENLISVVAIDMASSQPGLKTTEAVMTTGASKVYGTLDHLYIFDSHFDHESLDDNNTTNILKFDWSSDATDSDDGIELVSYGTVSGWLNDQFSADEHDGYLRIATTVDNNLTGNHSGNEENLLYVLRDDLGVMEIVGSVQNLALGEGIESVRFYGERALMTTFRNVDPLYGVDLSNPESPEVEGFLTLPGYSSYLQFIDANHVLAIGQDSAVNTRGATVVSLFEVSDLSNPQLVDQADFPRFTNSLAEADHHAFGWFAHHGVLATPAARTFTEFVDADNDGFAESREYRREDDLYVWNIDPTLGNDAIQLRGTVTHDRAIVRGAFINDDLYAISSGKITAVDVNDISRVTGAIEWVPTTDGDVSPGQFDRFSEPVEAAIADLASRLTVDESRVMLVVAEPDASQAGSARIVLRSGDTNYLYHADAAGVATLRRSNFAFDTSDAATTIHNESNPADTNNDGEVTPLDALLTINRLGQTSGSAVRQIESIENGEFVDVNNSGRVTPLDALLVINALPSSDPDPSSPVSRTDTRNADDIETGRATKVILPSSFATEIDDSPEDEKSNAALIDRVFASNE